MDRPITVSIVAAADVEPWVAVGIHDAFWAVGTLWNRCMGESEHPRFLPEIVAAKLGPMNTGTGVRIEPHKTIRDNTHSDIVFVPSLLIKSGKQFGRENAELVAWVRRSYENGATIVSACTGSFLIAEAGLLEGKEATTHWAFVDLMKAEYPGVRILPDRVLVSAGTDRRIVTSGGATSWSDLVLYLVGRFAGPEEARRLAKMSLFDWHHDGQNPYSRLTTQAAVRRQGDPGMPGLARLALPGQRSRRGDDQAVGPVAAHLQSPVQVGHRQRAARICPARAHRRGEADPGDDSTIRSRPSPAKSAMATPFPSAACSSAWSPARPPSTAAASACPMRCGISRRGGARIPPL